MEQKNLLISKDVLLLKNVENLSDLKSLASCFKNLFCTTPKISITEGKIKHYTKWKHGTKIEEINESSSVEVKKIMTTKIVLDFDGEERHCPEFKDAVFKFSLQ